MTGMERMMKRSYNYRTVCYFLLAVLVVGTILIQYALKLTDNDLWFHLAYGRYILEHRTLIPDHGFFSWSPSSNSTIYCAWIPEVIFYLLYRVGGMPIFFVVRYLCIILFVLCTIPLLKKEQGHLTPAILLIILCGLLMAQSGLRIKAEIFSFIFMTLMVGIWYKIKISPFKNRLLCYLFPVIVIIWVNSHGGFIFGLAFLGTILVGEVINRLSGSPEMLPPEARKHLFISVLCCAFAVVLTPYGWLYPAQLLETLLLDSGDFSIHTQGIMEYQTIFYPDAHHLHLIDYLIVSLGILILLLVEHHRRHKPDWSLLLSNALFICIYMRYLRTTYFWAIIFVFSALYLLRGVTRTDSRICSNTSLHPTIEAAVVAILLFFSVRAQYQCLCSPDFGFSVNYSSPIAEAEYIRRNFRNLRMGNDYDSGSYLLWALGNETKVFIDSRYFPYAEWYSEYDEFAYGKDKTAKDRFLKRYPCDLWCLTYDFPQIQYFLNSPEWKLVYYGPSSCIFLSSKIDYPHHRETAGSLYNVSFHQALSVSRFALQAGDLSIAKELLIRLKPFPFCKQQKSLALDAMMSFGNIMYSKERFMDAVDLYSGVLRIDRDSAPAYVMMGNAQARMNQLEDATKSYREAIRIKPDDDMAHNDLANILLLQHKFEEAIGEYSEALRVNPQSVQAQKNLTLAQGRKKMLEQKTLQLQVALKTDPDSIDILSALAAHYADQGRYEDAISNLKKAATLAPGNPGIYYNIACMYSRLNRVEESITWLELAIEKGFKNWSLLRTDHDLDNIRTTSFYKGLPLHQ